ncbi:class I SAM-dependent methyltransferase [Streptomyces griseus]|uniref:Class I SAM-dependent methyltransferase n=2 Tax=Streptomyces TaxID=1883 RepID=A0ABU2WAN4_9ACTN|nr:class I SAM-dependent methyltransferase [Streptomyces griseus]MDT0494944.1 class I SAM-dependent methyltransferase [Streptomyces griseus]
MSRKSLGEIYAHAEIYEAVYRARRKDYRAESDEARSLIREFGTDARSLLDVACGNGPHLRYFREDFAHVEGVDVSADMVRLARHNLPGVPVHQGDMADFRLERTFDAITCMFSSVGYLHDTGELNSAAESFVRHLNPGGVVVLEPWYFPDTFVPGQIMSTLATEGGRTISRISHATREEGDIARVVAHYLVADPASGVEHFIDSHDLKLFTRREYETAFERAGCTVHYRERGAKVGMFAATLGRGR